MPVVPSTAEIVGPACAAGRAAVAFNVIGIEHAEAIVTGAQQAGEPVILQVSENCIDYHGALAPIGRAMLATAAAATVPVAVHLDHATRERLVRQAVALGFGSVMYDASALPYADNVRATARIAGLVSRRTVSGSRPSSARSAARTACTSRAPGPGPARRPGYVTATGVDALAVAVGSSHAMLTRDAVLDLELIARLRAAVPVPLVLHGSSGVPDDDAPRRGRAPGSPRST